MAKTGEEEYEAMIGTTCRIHASVNLQFLHPTDKGRKETTVIISQTPLNDPTLLGASWKMILLFSAGIFAVIAHHSLYEFLNGKAVDSDDDPLSPFKFNWMLHTSVSDQALASTLGNTIATVAKLCFAGAISSAFVQLFWWRMRRRGCTVSAVHVLVNNEIRLNLRYAYCMGALQ